MVSTFPALTAAGLGVITVEPIPDVTPFTIRSGATYESILSGIRVWIRDELVPHLNEHGAEATFQGYIDTMIDAVNSALGAQAATVTAALNEAVREVVTADIPITAALFDTMGLHVSPPPSGGDDTAAFQAWLNSLPAKSTGTVRSGATYSLTTVTIPAGVTIFSHGAVWKAAAGTANFVTLGDSAKLIGAELDGSLRTGSANAVVTAANTAGQVFDGLYIHNWPKGGVAVQNATDWLVTRCRVVSCGTAGISATFASRGRIADCIMVNAHGIQWWGGDSAVVTTQGVSNLVITGNLVVNGAIWGSCGNFVTVTGNIVDGASDVGIDLEGCTDCVVTGNTVRNAVNGCYSVFYGSTRCSFIGNIAYQDAGFTGPAFKAFTGNTNTFLLIVDNIFNTVGNAVTTDQNGLGNSTIRGNRILSSTGFGIRILDGGGNIKIINNDIRVSGPTGISFEGPSDSRIEENEVSTSADTTAVGAGSAGIYLYWRSASYPTQRNRVRNNVIRGFVQSVFDNCWTGKDTAFNLVENNIARRVTMRTGTSSIAANNRDDSTHAVVAPTLI